MEHLSEIIPVSHSATHKRESATRHETIVRNYVMDPESLFRGDDKVIVTRETTIHRSEGGWAREPVETEYQFYLDGNEIQRRANQYDSDNGMEWHMKVAAEEMLQEYDRQHAPT